MTFTFKLDLTWCELSLRVYSHRGKAEQNLFFSVCTCLLVVNVSSNITISNNPCLSASLLLHSCWFHVRDLWVIINTCCRVWFCFDMNLNPLTRILLIDSFLHPLLPFKFRYSVKRHSHIMRVKNESDCKCFTFLLTLWISVLTDYEPIHFRFSLYLSHVEWSWGIGHSD